MKSHHWPETSIIASDGTTHLAIAPGIISASRSTDIPALYVDWFFHQLEQGYTVWTNPFNGTAQFISFENTRIIAFWSKNPSPIMHHLASLDKLGIRFFFQVTLNDYEKEHFEPGIPSLAIRIDNFKSLSDQIGKNNIFWRFDPIILTDTLTTDKILDRIEYIGDRISSYTRQLTVSFFSPYQAAIRKMAKSGIYPLTRTDEQIKEIGSGLSRLSRKWNLPITTCAESADMHLYGILPGSCIDPVYVMSVFQDNPQILNQIGFKIQNSLFSDPEQLRKQLKDPGQRPLCNCMFSKDIGRYGTCRLGCIYCYAGGCCNTRKTMH